MDTERKRMIFIGDTGGNTLVLQGCLERAGVIDGRVPEDVVIVHVGDIVRRRPVFYESNLESMKLVRQMLHDNPDGYVQLIGNHEVAAMLGEGSPWDPTGCFSDETTDIIFDLWYSGKMRLAIAANTGRLDQILVTHAGLTRPRWTLIGSPTDAFEAADLINRDMARPVEEWTEYGLVGPGEFNPIADVTWAEINAELHLPWITVGDSPFTQVHGHANPLNWRTGQWWPRASEEARKVTAIDVENRLTWTRLNDHTEAVSVDWGLGDEPYEKMPKWELLSLGLV